MRRLLLWKVRLRNELGHESQKLLGDYELMSRHEVMESNEDLLRASADTNTCQLLGFVVQPDDASCMTFALVACTVARYERVEWTLF